MRNSLTSFLLGALIGGVVGASIALLYTPSSGEGVRDQLQKYVGTVKNEITQAVQNRRSELEQQLASMRSAEPPKA